MAYLTQTRQAHKSNLEKACGLCLVFLVIIFANGTRFPYRMLEAWGLKIRFGYLRIATVLYYVASTSVNNFQHRFALNASEKFNYNATVKTGSTFGHFIPK